MVDIFERWTTSVCRMDKLFHPFYSKLLPTNPHIKTTASSTQVHTKSILYIYMYMYIPICIYKVNPISTGITTYIEHHSALEKELEKRKRKKDTQEHSSTTTPFPPTHTTAQKLYTFPNSLNGLENIKWPTVASIAQKIQYNYTCTCRYKVNPTTHLHVHSTYIQQQQCQHTVVLTKYKASQQVRTYLCEYFAS